MFRTSSHFFVPQQMQIKKKQDFYNKEIENGSQIVITCTQAFNKFIDEVDGNDQLRHCYNVRLKYCKFLQFFVYV